MRPEAGDDVLGVVLGDLVEVAFVGDLQDQLLHVVGLVGVLGDQRVEAHLDAARIVFRRPERRLLAVVEGQEIVEAADLLQRDDVVLEGAVGDAGFVRVDLGAAELLGRHVLVRHRLHHVGTGDEHVGGVAHHEDEVGHGRRVDVAAGAGAHDDADLRHHARGEHVALEDLAVAGEAGDAFLDARAAGVEQPDDGRAVLHRHVLHLADLLRVRFGERAAEDGEVLGEDVDHAAVDGAPAGDDTVARDDVLVGVEVLVAVLDEHVELLEGVRVEQKLDTLAGSELALGVLGLDAGGAAAGAGAVAAGFELLQDVLHRWGLASGNGGSGGECGGMVRGSRVHAEARRRGEKAPSTKPVMAGFMPAIHTHRLAWVIMDGVRALPLRTKGGHDEREVAALLRASAC